MLESLGESGIDKKWFRIQAMGDQELSGTFSRSKKLWPWETRLAVVSRFSSIIFFILGVAQEAVLGLLATGSVCLLGVEMLSLAQIRIRLLEREIENRAKRPFSPWSGVESGPIFDLLKRMPN